MSFIRAMVHVECDEEDAILGVLIRRVDLCPFPLAAIWRRNRQAACLISNALSAKTRNKSKRSTRADGYVIWVKELGIYRLILHTGQRLGSFVAMLMGCGNNGAMILANLVDPPPHVIYLTAHLHLLHVSVPAA